MGCDVEVFCYDIKVLPEVEADCFLKHAIIRTVRKKIELLVGKFILGGNNIFTSCNLNETLLVDSRYKDNNYTIRIDHSTKMSFNLNSVKNY